MDHAGARSILNVQASFKPIQGVSAGLGSRGDTFVVSDQACMLLTSYCMHHGLKDEQL